MYEEGLMATPSNIIIYRAGANEWFTCPYWLEILTDCTSLDLGRCVSEKAEVVIELSWWCINPWKGQDTKTHAQQRQDSNPNS